MSTIQSTATRSKMEHILILYWTHATPSLQLSIERQFSSHTVNYVSLQDLCPALVEEHKASKLQVAPGRYVFTRLMSDGDEDHPQIQLARKVLREHLLRATVIASLSLLPKDRDAVPRLKLLHILSAGVEMILDHPLLATRSTFSVTSSRGIHGVPIAEWVAMMILSFRRNLSVSTQHFQQHLWPADKSASSLYSTLRGKTAGILGYGSIGREVARMLTSFGCKCLVYTATCRPDLESRRDHGYCAPGTGDPDGLLPLRWFSGQTKAELHHFLAQGLELLIIAAPLTPATECMLSDAEFDVLHKSTMTMEAACFLVNVSRGRLVDQNALIAALEHGKLSGAALDVAVPEPLPSDSPLWTAKNVFITPHTSTLTSDYLLHALDVLKANLERSQLGEAMYNVLDIGRGY